jgi:hypothetical protein
VHSGPRLAIVLVAAIAAIAAVGVASPALAQDREQEAPIDTPVGSHRHHVYESPQNFAAEIRFGLWNPAIDSDPALSGAPFKQAFGTAPRLLVSAEFDWQAFRIPHLGTIGPGIGAGYASISRPAQLATCPPTGSCESGETTTLQVFPFDLVAVLRADVLYRSFHVPLVPYVKAGLGYAIWRASNSLGTSRSKDGGVLGVGSSLGSHVAVGLALNLNPFDEYAARGFDESLGVNGTYLFAEWTREDLTGLGIQHDPMRVGGMSWTFGLALEF